jgi:hypothetical protein
VQDTAVTLLVRSTTLFHQLMRIPTLLVLLASFTAPAVAAAQVHDHARHRPSAARPADSAFAALQQRGAGVMGVDQYTSTHRFEALNDGGRIELQRDPSDTAGVRTIREHLQAIAHAFASGDFSASATVHAQTVPGTAVMSARRQTIR